MKRPLVLFLIFAASIAQLVTAQTTDSLRTEQYYKDILNRNKKSAFANIGLATLCLQNGEYDQAAHYAQSCIDLKSDYELEAWLVLATTNDLQKQTIRTIATINKAIKRFPQQGILWYNLAFAQYKNMEYQNSLLALDSAIAKESGLQESYILKGIVLYEKENNQQAIAYLMYGIMLNPREKLSFNAFRIMWALQSKNHTAITLPDFDKRKEIQGLYDLTNVALSERIDDVSHLKADKWMLETESYLQSHSDLPFNLFWKQLLDNGHLAAFSYYLLQAVDEEQSLIWMKKNHQQMVAFADWLEKTLK